MSHFSVTVRITAARLKKHKGDVQEAASEILAPYDEASEDERFIHFVDEEDEWRAEYADPSKTTSAASLPETGELVCRYGEHRALVERLNLSIVEAPYAAVYSTFGEFAHHYHGHPQATPDSKTGRYGFWRTKDPKWDWWSIGGRWTGHFPLKPGVRPVLGESGAGGNKPERGHGDVVSVMDIDLDGALREQTVRMKDFWRDWEDYLAGKKFDAFDGPRPRAMNIGLLRVEHSVVTAGPGERVALWRDAFPNIEAGDEQRDWSDVMKLITEEEFFRDYQPDFDPLATYAGLDDEGWAEPGKMGWWGMTAATAETSRPFKAGFRDRFIKAADPADRLVIVDAHV